MKDFWESVWMYWGGWKFFFLEAVCLLILFYRRKKRNAFRITICLLISMLIFVLNPFSRKFWIRIVAQHLYWRMFWILPLVPAAALAFTEVSEHFSGKVRCAAIAAAAAVVILCGKNVYSYDNFQPAPNKFKLPQDAVMVADYLTGQGKKRKRWCRTVCSVISDSTVQKSLCFMEGIFLGTLRR